MSAGWGLCRARDFEDVGYYDRRFAEINKQCFGCSWLEGIGSGGQSGALFQTVILFQDAIDDRGDQCFYR